MTGLIDSDVKPVHSVSKDEGLNLLEPASKSEYIKKNLYPGRGSSVQRLWALSRIKIEKSGFLYTFWRDFISKPRWAKIKQIGLLVAGIVSILLLVLLFLGIAALIEVQTSTLPPIIRAFVGLLLYFVALPFVVLKYLPVLPLSPRKLDIMYSLNSRKILMKSENPVWINDYLLKAWPILNDATWLEIETRAQTHENIVSRSKEFGDEGTIWNSLNKYCITFLRDWSNENSKERIPMILWAFNPPNSDSGAWGELREQHIDFAQRSFSKMMRDLLEEMENLTVRDKTLEEWGQSDYSFRWLESKMKDKTPRNNVLVKALIKWNSM